MTLNDKEFQTERECPLTVKCFVSLGDTNALCVDMKDFAQDYVDYSNMARQLIPETNTVQHWSKIIETKYGVHALNVLK